MQHQWTTAQQKADGSTSRRMAQRAAVVYEEVTPEVIRQLVRVLIARARDGDVAAIKLLLEYSLGKP